MLCLEQLDKIDDDMKKLLMDKLNILRAMQGGVGGHRSTDSTPKHVAAKDLNTPKAIVGAAIEQGKDYLPAIHIGAASYYSNDMYIRNY